MFVLTEEFKETLRQAILSRLSDFPWDHVDAGELLQMHRIAQQVVTVRTEGLLGPNEQILVTLNSDCDSGNLGIDLRVYKASTPEEQAALTLAVTQIRDGMVGLSWTEPSVETEDHIDDAGKVVSPEPVADHVVDADKMVQDFMWRNSFGNKLLKAALLYGAGLLKIDATADESNGTVTVTFKRRDTKP